MEVTDSPEWKVELTMTCPRCGDYFDAIDQYLKHEINYLSRFEGSEMIFVCPTCEENLTIDYIGEYEL